MTNRQFFLESITNTIADYRQGELDPPTPDHVDRWIKQFDLDAQLPMLKELDHVLQQTYFSRANVEEFLTNLITCKDLVGNNPLDFWKNTNFLDIQQNGSSQSEMLSIFKNILKDELQIDIDECGSENGDFIYLDDVTFSGNRVKYDLIKWIKTTAPQKTKVHVIAIATYSSSEYVFRVPIKKSIEESGKDIKTKIWRCVEFENQKRSSSFSDVFWARDLPTTNHPIYGEVLEYCQTLTNNPFCPRGQMSAQNKVFSCEEGRHILEQQLLIAGVYIRSLCTEPKEILRPYGFGQFGLGFGSTVVTFRNCPNNSPLAFWWGDCEKIHSSSHPFSKWYPLFPRKTYDNTF